MGFFSGEEVNAYTPQEGSKNYWLNEDRQYASNRAAQYDASAERANAQGQVREQRFNDQGQAAQRRAYDANTGLQNRATAYGNRGAEELSAARMQAAALGGQAQQYGVQAQQAYGQNLQSREAQMAALGRVGDYYQQGPGQSAAEAQLRQGAERNMSQSLALSRSGRGAGVDAAAQRQAMSQNAATGQELNQQMGLLRAQESDAWRGRQLQAMGLEQQGYGNVRSQDQGAMSSGQQAALGYEGAAQSRLGLGQQYSGQMTQAQLAALGQGLQAQQMGNQAALGFGELGQKAYGSGALMEQGYAGMSDGILQSQQQAWNQYHALKGGQAVGAGTANAQSDAQRDAAWLAMFGSIASDERTKKDAEKKGFLSGIASALGMGGEEEKEEQQPKARPRTGITKQVTRSAYPTPQQPNTPALDQAYARQGAPQFDFRPAEGHTYKYKEPVASALGYQDQTFYGPMAQDLEKTPAGAQLVQEAPNGTKGVDPQRAGVMAVAGLSEQQRRMDELEQQVAALSGTKVEYPTPKQPGNDSDAMLRRIRDDSSQGALSEREVSAMRRKDWGF